MKLRAPWRWTALQPQMTILPRPTVKGGQLQPWPTKDKQKKNKKGEEEEEEDSVQHEGGEVVSDRATKELGVAGVLSMFAGVSTEGASEGRLVKLLPDSAEMEAVRAEVGERRAREERAKKDKREKKDKKKKTRRRRRARGGEERKGRRRRTTRRRRGRRREKKPKKARKEGKRVEERDGVVPSSSVAAVAAAIAAQTSASNANLGSMFHSTEDIKEQSAKSLFSCTGGRRF